MKEYWNVGFILSECFGGIKKSCLSRKIISFHVKRDFADEPMPHFLGTHCSMVPVFQHPNCEQSELSSIQDAA
jgi:hypothetical protein